MPRLPGISQKEAVRVFLKLGYRVVQGGLLRKPPFDDVQALSGDLQLVPTGDGRKAQEADYAAMTTPGMLRGEVPTFSELMERMVLLEQQCNAIARSVS